jgi:hypothetical protein
MLTPLLPRKCVESIQENGIALSRWNPGSEEVAFNRKVALNFLQDLVGSSIAILGVDVVRIVDGQLDYFDESWAARKRSGESPLEYAAVSVGMAREYVMAFRSTGESDPLFIFVLSAQI